MALTKGSWAVNTISSLANRVTGQATALKENFDKAGSDIKTYINSTLTVEIDALDSQNTKLTGNQTVAGVKTFTSSPVVPAPTTDLQASTKKYADDILATANAYADQVEVDSKAYTDTVAANFELGILVDDGITNAKLGTDIKVGSIAALLTTVKTSVVGAINELYNAMVTLTGTQELSNKTLVAPLIKATVGDPTILATGAAADVNLQLSAKGAGKVFVGNTSVRLNGTAFEYWNGTGWATLGAKLAIESDTLQHSVDTEITGAKSAILIARMFPDFSGTIKVKFDAIDSASSSLTLKTALHSGAGANGVDIGQWNYTTVDILSVAIGTENFDSPIPATLSAPAANSLTASYATYTHVFQCTSGTPMMWFTTLSATQKLKNFRIYYDLLTQTEVM